MPDITLALSGGGAAGLGHIPILQALDDLGLRPVAVAGASMGALLGACYAAGMSGGEIRAHALALSADPLAVIRRFWTHSDFSLKSLSLQIETEAAIRAVLPDPVPAGFDALETPLFVTATDFHARRRLTLTDGDLVTAIAGSVAIPGVFQPVRRNGRVLIDGGVTDNLPVRALPPADLCIAVDVASEPPSDSDEMPGVASQIAGAMRIMMRTMLTDGLAHRPGTLVFEPASRSFGALDFDKTDDIFAAVDGLRETARTRIAAALAGV